MIVSATADKAGSPHLTIQRNWLALVTECALEPDVAIVDAHHHLWDRPTGRYLMDDYLDDIHSGHQIVASVYVQCRSMFDLNRPEGFKSVGEVEFANGVAACSASGCYGPLRLCAAIVSGADLTLGEAVVPVLEEMRQRAGSRLQGVRNTTAWHSNPAIVTNPSPPAAGILGSAGFCQGVQCLREFGLVLDVWGYHTQIPEILQLARAFPDQMIVVDHLGGPLGIGGYTREGVFPEWMKMIQQLAQCPNVLIKLGGLGMSVGGFDLHQRALPPTSEELARLWRPYILHCIDCFGVDRCMFESNFPVDKGMYSYGVLWNAFKRITMDFSGDEKSALFRLTAAKTYRIQLG